MRLIYAVRKYLLVLWLIATPTVLFAEEVPESVKDLVRVMGGRIDEVTFSGQGGNCLPLSIATVLEQSQSDLFYAMMAQYSQFYEGWFFRVHNLLRDHQYNTARAIAVRRYLAAHLQEILQDSQRLEALRSILSRLSDVRLVSAAHHQGERQLIGQVGRIIEQILRAGDAPADEIKDFEAIINALFDDFNENRVGMTGVEVAVLLAIAIDQPVMVVEWVNNQALDIILIQPGQVALGQGHNFEHVVIPVAGDALQFNDQIQVQLLEWFNLAGVHLFFTPRHAQPLLRTLPDSAFVPALNGLPMATDGGGDLYRGRSNRQPLLTPRQRMLENRKHNPPRRLRKPFKPATSPKAPASQVSSGVVKTLLFFSPLVFFGGYQYARDPEGWSQFMWKLTCGDSQTYQQCAERRLEQVLNGCENAAGWAVEQASSCWQMACGQYNLNECVNYYLPEKK